MDPKTLSERMMASLKDVFKSIPDTVYIFLGFFIFFLLNLTSNFSGPHDSMGYLNDFDKGRDLFPAPHLLYHYTTYLLLHFLTFLLPHVEHYYLVEAIDACWGCLGLTVVYRIFLHRIQMNRKESLLGTTVIAFSFGFWFYSSNIEVYMPPLFFLLYCLYICTKKNLEPKDIFRLAVLHALAILFHQANVLFTPIILYKIWSSRKTIPFIKSLIRYCAISATAVIVIFFIFGWYIDRQNNLGDFYKWLRGYTLESNYWFELGFGTLVKALVGFGHAFFGGHYIFRIRFLESFMNRIFFYHSLDDEAYLVRNLSYHTAVVLLILTIVVCLAIFILLFRIILNKKKLFRESGHIMIPLLMFLLIYSCFFYFWMPENLEFWIPQCAVFWIFLLGMNKRLEHGKLYRHASYLYGSLTLLLLIINYEGSIYWMKDINNDSVYVKVKKVAVTSTNKDIILLQDPWLLEDFLQHYSPSVISRVPDQPQQIYSLNKKVVSCLFTGGKIFLFTEDNSMHSSKNKIYIDSLLRSGVGRVSDLENNLTPVQILAR